MARLSSALRAARTLASASVAIEQIDRRLRRSGLERVLATIDASGVPRATVTPRELRSAQRDAQLIATAARLHPRRAHCLHRSLVLHEMLRRRGVPSHFQIGVHKRGTTLAAHAWVEVAGVIVNDSPGATAGFARLRPGTLPDVNWSLTTGIPSAMELE